MLPSTYEITCYVNTYSSSFMQGCLIFFSFNSNIILEIKLVKNNNSNNKLNIFKKSLLLYKC